MGHGEWRASSDPRYGRAIHLRIRRQERKYFVKSWFKYRRRYRALFAAGAALSILALWGFWWEPSSLSVVHRTITVRPWHPELSALRVAVMSDLHVGSPFLNVNSLQKIVART